MKRIIAAALLMVPTFASAQGWIFQESTDPFSDVHTTEIVLAASLGTNTYGNPVWLFLGSSNGNAYVGIDWNEYVTPNQVIYILSRIDGDPPEDVAWSLKNQKTTYYPGNIIDMVKRLMNAAKFVVRVDLSSGQQVTATFDVRGLADAIDPHPELKVPLAQDQPSPQ